MTINAKRQAAIRIIESSKAWLRESEEHWPEGCDREWFEGLITVAQGYLDATEKRKK